jgi:hypothetical protein
MATFNISKGTNSITVNNYTEQNPDRYIIDTTADPIVAIKGDSGFVFQVNINEDTIIVNEQEFNGTAEELKTLLFSDVFVNSGSGGSGGGTILQSPDSTLWQVQINDAGVLVTAQVTSGTAGTLHLFSPDNTEWNVTVTNAGALETTAV